MGVDIFNVTPHEISRDLKGYTIMFYGQPKTGKTTTAAKFPKALVLAFETGYLAIPGVMAMPINKWSEFKQVIKQLREDKAHEMYDNIIVDTVDICYDLCEKYICNQNNVSTIGEIPYGGGYAQTGKEFDEALRSIPQMGYGLIMISHSQDKTFKDETGAEYNQIVPTLSNRPRNIVDRMADIIGYAHPTQDEETGETHTTLYMRGTPRFVAGSRFRFTPNSIPFSYENLVDAIGEAIDKEAAACNGQYVTDKPTKAHEVKPDRNFDDAMAEFKDLVATIRKNVDTKIFKEKWAPKITEITESYLGTGHKVTECKPAQLEQLELILEDLKEEVGNGIE